MTAKARRPGSADAPPRDAARRRRRPRRVIAVCAGTGCRANGAVDVYEALRAEVEARGAARRVETRATGCLGFCQGGPMLLLFPEGIVYQHVRVEDVPEIVAKTVLGGEVVERLLYVDPATDLRCRRRRRSPSTATSSVCCCATTAFSTLRPSTTTSPSAATRPWQERWRSGPRRSSRRSSTPACAAAAAPASPPAASGRPAARPAGEPKYVICNADEGDPGAFMDRACSRAIRTACSRA